MFNGRRNTYLKIIFLQGNGRVNGAKCPYLYMIPLHAITVLADLTLVPNEAIPQLHHSDISYPAYLCNPVLIHNPLIQRATTSMIE